MSGTPSSLKRLNATGLLDYALLFLLGAIWGGSFPVIRLAVHELDPVIVTFGRLFIAAGIMLFIASVWAKFETLRLSQWTVLVAIAVFGNALPFFLISWGEKEVEAGTAAIIMAIMPLIVLLLAHALTQDEKITKAKLFGLVGGFVGVVVLVEPWATQSTSLSSSFLTSPWHVIAIGFAAVCYAINAMLMRIVADLDRIFVVSVVLSIATLLVLPFAVSVLMQLIGDAAPVGLETTFAVLLLGVVQTAFATLLMFQIVRRQGATFFSLINFIVPVFGVMIGAVWLGEHVQPNAILALGLILGGVALSRRVA